MSLTTTLEFKAKEGEFRLIGFDSVAGCPYLVRDYLDLEEAENRIRREQKLDRRLGISDKSFYSIYDHNGILVKDVYD